MIRSQIFLKTLNQRVVVENRPFIDTRLEVQWIPEISGWGIFATADIPIDTIVERASLIVYPAKISDMTFWLLQAEGVKSEDMILDRYLLKWKGVASAVPLGWSGLYNHSDQNNATFQNCGEDELIEIRTIKPILAGEQCLVSYGDQWFTARGYVKKVDF